MPARSYTASKRSERLQAIRENPPSPDVPSVVDDADDIAKEVFGMTVADDGIDFDSPRNPLWSPRSATLPAAATSSTTHIKDALNDVLRASIPPSDQTSYPSSGAGGSTLVESSSTTFPPVLEPTGSVTGPSSAITGHSIRLNRRSDNATHRALACLDHIELDVSAYEERKRFLDADRSLVSFLELRDRLDRIKSDVGNITRKVDAVIDRKRRIDDQIAALHGELQEWKDQIKLGPESCVYDSGAF